jgi:hypothetical protein
MTAKEKAISIFNKMQMDFIYFASKEISKRNALIAVEEILHTCVESRIYYWQEVKQELINL